MKKIFLLSIIFLSLRAFAFDYSSYCSTGEVNKTFSGNILSATGVNFISRNIIEKQIARAFKKETNSKFKVNIDSFFGANILNGEFKSFRARSNAFSYKGLFASNLYLQTMCPYNKVSYIDKKLIFDKSTVLKYTTDITQDDLNKIVSSSQYKKILDKMNNDKAISNLIKIKETKVKIKDDRLVFKYEVLPFPKIELKNIKPIDIVFAANLKVEDNKLVLCDFDLNSFKSKDKLTPLINALNPLSYGVKIDKNNKGKLEITDAKISDSKIKLEGFIIIPKTL